MNRDEHKLEGQHLDLQERLTKAKEAAREAVARHGDAAKLRAPKVFADLEAAKLALSDFRVEWRGIRDAFTVPADGVATPVMKKAAKAAAKVGN